MKTSNFRGTGIKNILKGNRNTGLFIDPNGTDNLAEILLITSYPPRECGIATYSQDLVKALSVKFKRSFTIRICPLESETEMHQYGEEINFMMNTDNPESYGSLAYRINTNSKIKMVMIQHEFGFFSTGSIAFISFLKMLRKPVLVVFHTVLPNPGVVFMENVRAISAASESVVVMTQASARILRDDYGIEAEKVVVIPHGTHLVTHSGKDNLKQKYGLSSRKVLATFGLLNSGKSIETTLDALPAIVQQNPEVIFLIIGKTHPGVIKCEGEAYRNLLEKKVTELKLEHHVRFINAFLPLDELLEYLQLTDVYLFTSKDPHQAVSGTFSYAISCGCPIVSTPIPHAVEVLGSDSGIIIDFGNPHQLSGAVINLLNNAALSERISSNGLHRIAPTAWENVAIAHAMLFRKMVSDKITIEYEWPEINLGHILKLTTDFGMIQFSQLNQPDINSGFTLDDNARALIAVCQYLQLTADNSVIKQVRIYLDFIKFCQQPDGNFLNYVDEQKRFTRQNSETNLNDANGRAIWALGYLISLGELLPLEMTIEAQSLMQKALLQPEDIYSSRAMAFIIKGIYYSSCGKPSDLHLFLTRTYADRLVQMYEHEASEHWEWFESYLTYANSVLPEAMLCAWLMTGERQYRDMARTSFDFLISKTFISDRIKVISNKKWLLRDDQYEFSNPGGEQPIDVSYTIITLSLFFQVFKEVRYIELMKNAFDWFLGNNELQRIVYNPCTGGCYDGLEEYGVNLNQGAESTVSYLMAKLTIEATFKAAENNAAVNFPYRLSLEVPDESELSLVDCLV